ncbi:hypothetical protein [uncultured Bosea sp.]|uniref:hypothetical protein n=1 Tax=uncultured Bosea sp. TaxID=211457 RepID=UPI00345C40B4
MTAAPFPMMRLRTEDVPRREQMAFVYDFVARHVGGLQFRPADRDNIQIDLEERTTRSPSTVGRPSSRPGPISASGSEGSMDHRSRSLILTNIVALFPIAGQTDAMFASRSTRN